MSQDRDALWDLWDFQIENSTEGQQVTLMRTKHHSKARAVPRSLKSWLPGAPTRQAASTAVPEPLCLSLERGEGV